MTQTHLGGANGSAAQTQLEEQGQSWLQKLPKTPLALASATGMGHLTPIVGLLHGTEFERRGVEEHDDRERLEHVNALATALRVDMTKWFAPTAENFFSRIPKSRIAEAIEEAGKRVTAVTRASKKADLAMVAQKEVQGTRETGSPPKGRPVRSAVGAVSEAVDTKTV